MRQESLHSIPSEQAELDERKRIDAVRTSPEWAEVVTLVYSSSFQTAIIDYRRSCCVEKKGLHDITTNLWPGAKPFPYAEIKIRNRTMSSYIGSYEDALRKTNFIEFDSIRVFNDENGTPTIVFDPLNMAKIHLDITAGEFVGSLEEFVEFLKHYVASNGHNESVKKAIHTLQG